MAPIIPLRHKMTHVHRPSRVRLRSPASPTFDPRRDALRTLLHKPAFDFHDAMQGLYVDAPFPAPVQGPVDSADSGLGGMIDECRISLTSVSVSL